MAGVLGFERSPARSPLLAFEMPLSISHESLGFESSEFYKKHYGWTTGSVLELFVRALKTDTVSELRRIYENS